MGAADRIADTLLRIGEIQGTAANRSAEIQARALEQAAQARAQGVTGSADALARATAANGQIWGQTLTSLGELPNQYLRTAAALKTNDLENQGRQIQIDRAKQVQAGEAAFQKILPQIPRGQDGLFDVSAATPVFASSGMTAEQTSNMIRTLDALNQAQVGVNKTRIDHAADLANHALEDAKKTGEPLSVPGAVLWLNGAREAGVATDAEVNQIKQGLVNGADPTHIFSAIRGQSDKYKPKPITNETELALAAAGGDPAKAQALTKPPAQPTEATLALQASGGNPAAALDRLKPPAQPAQQPRPTEVDLALKAAGGDPTAAAALRLLKPAPAGGMTPDASAKRADAKTVAQGIKDFVDTGQGLSPEILLSSRTTEQGMALNAELRNLGVDTAKLTREWTATKGAIRSLNGASQIRLAEVINKASSSLDKLDELNQQWSQNATRWGIKALNKASLVAAQNGVYGPEAQSVATRLDSQIADVTSELGQGIMGGNSPTDHAFGLASKNLSSDWTQKTLSDAIKQVRYNLNLAQQARNELLNQVGVQSTQVQTPAPAAQSGGVIYARDPQGHRQQATAGTPLPAGWTLEP